MLLVSTSIPCTAIVTCNTITAEDKGIGTSIGSKIIVVFSQFLAWGQLLLIPLDVSNGLGSDSDSMQILYSVVYIVIFVFTSFIIPFNIFLYESDEEDSMQSRILWSILFSIAICGLWSAFIFISYIWLAKYTVSGVEYTVPVPLYMMVCMSLIGWIFLALNAGVGLIFLPYELIKDYFIRPKQLNSEQAF